jgi:GTP-binding protein
MRIQTADLAAMAVKPAQYPPDDRPEIAFAGRSNVGKSSLLNLLTGRRVLARVSGTPGKTRTINFYDVNDAFRIVDLPGYGYARLSKSITEGWGGMIEAYVTGRKNLLAVALLADVRHRPSALDLRMYAWLRGCGLDGLVVATKADKVSKGELSGRLRVIRETLELGEADRIVAVSALKKTGADALLAELERLIGA